MAISATKGFWCSRLSAAFEAQFGPFGREAFARTGEAKVSVEALAGECGDGSGNV